MKKSMILIGMLSIGYAHSQEYDGKVGINTNEPKATLDITPEASNLTGTTNEGLLIPRLSKERVAKMASPAVSTLVYVNEFASYSGSDAKVVDIDAIGFYHYNGTKWVKHIDTDTNTSIWSKVNKNITLLDSDLVNTVKYTTEGQYWNIPKELRKVSYFDPNTLTTTTNTIDFDNDIQQIGQAGNVNLGYADKLFTSNTANAIWKGKKLYSNFLLVDEKNDATTVDRLYTQTNTLQTNELSTKNYSALYAQTNNVEHYGTGTVNLMIGSFNNSGVFKGSATRVVGSYNQAGTRSASTTNIFEGSYNLVNPRSSSIINNMYGTRNHIILDSRSTNQVGKVVGSHSEFSVAGNFTGKLTEVIGTYLNFTNINKRATGIDDVYGLKITNVDQGIKSNYSIYTEKGNIRFGDLADTSATTDRVVTVDANGVLKVGTTSATNSGVKATTTAETCSDTNLGAIHFKEVEISGTNPIQKKGVFGFCTKQNNTAMWVYLSNGGNIMQGTGTFGQGL